MLIDGEKWACEACVRGHRVSNCQHYDRPLQHINKKGRPVTQCQHCRSQRKNRAAHVKCDCGEKTNKCIHLGAVEGHRESCCCNHGGRCSCAFKNDLDTVPETSGVAEDEAEEELSAPATAGGSASTGTATTSGSPPNKNPIRRRRANTTRSEGTLTFDEHGRHKPVSQKHAKVVSQKTNPYPISRVSSSRSMFRAGHDDDELDDNNSNGNTDSDNGGDDAGSCSLEAAAAAAAATNCGTFLPAQLSQQRRSRSETASPLMFASSFPQAHQLSRVANGPLAPLNMGMVGGYNISGNNNNSNSSNSNNNNFATYNAFSPEQMDQPLFSAGLSAPSVDWSQFGLDFDRGFSTSTEDKFASAEAFGFTRNFGYEFNGSELAPTMTTGTSGEVSEAEDPIVPGLDDYEYDYDYDATNDAASGSIAFSRTNSSFNLPSVASVVNVRSNTISGDMNEFRYLKAGNKFLPTPLTGVTDDIATLQAMAGMPQVAGRDGDESALWMNEYTGLPSMTESPESDVMSFWATK